MPSTYICRPLTEMAFMQSRYVDFCRQVNATPSCCMRSLRLLHLFSSAMDIVHHLTLALGGAAKHRAVERIRNRKSQRGRRTPREEKKHLCEYMISGSLQSWPQVMAGCRISLAHLLSHAGRLFLSCLMCAPSGTSGRIIPVPR